MWQFWLAGDEDTEPSLVLLDFPPALYMTLAGSLGSDSKCRVEAWRYLLSGVKAISEATASGELAEGEWGTVRRADG